MSGTYSKKASNGKKEDTKFSVVIPRTETELDSLISLLDENGTKSMLSMMLKEINY